MSTENNAKTLLSEKRIEIIVAIFLAVTALFTAWASWIGSLHGGNQATNYTKSNNAAAEGNSQFNEASQNVMQDMMLWNEITDLQLEISYATSNGDEDAKNLASYKLYYKCFDNLSDNMAAAIGFDFKEAEKAANDPTKYIDKWLKDEKSTQSPFSSEDFSGAYYKEATEKLDESNSLLTEGMTDNTRGDSYNLVTVFYSVVLFLLGIAGTFKNIPCRKAVVAVAIIGFVISTVYMFTIPMPTGFNFMSFFKH